jgi:CRISPR-associated exonuclease Cas4
MIYKEYSEEEILMLSGIQHFAFCKRQWALIHIEQLWAENVRTIEGQFLHKRSDDPFQDETRKGLRSVRAMPLVSYTLGLRGIADVVEFTRVELETEYTTTLKDRQGFWLVCPVEFKRGKPKKDDRDAVQLCAQTICLEEMMSVKIGYGDLYYAQTRHRQRIEIDEQLRSRVYYLSEKKHEMFIDGKTPPTEVGKHCSICSMVELCNPRLTKKYRSVSNYLKAALLDAESKEGE